MRRWHLLAAAVAAAGLVTAAGAQIFQDRRGPADEGRMYSGGSDRGDFQEALGNAINKAQKTIPGADRLLKYRVDEIRGEAGGIRGVNHLDVRIELIDDAERPGRPDDNGRDLERALVPQFRVSPARASRDDEVTLTLNVRNTADHDLDLRFPRGQRYEFEAYRGDRLLWKWSDSRAFIARDQREIVHAGDELTYRETLNLRRLQGLATGEVTIRAFFLPDGVGRRVSDERTLTVTR